MSRPKSCEFSYQTRQEVRKRGVCAECGEGYDPDDPWEVHHKIYLEYGLRKNMPHAVLRSLANADLLHRSCHQHIHLEYEAPSQEVVNFVLSQVAIQLGLWAKTG